MESTSTKNKIQRFIYISTFGIDWVKFIRQLNIKITILSKEVIEREHIKLIFAHGVVLVPSTKDDQHKDVT